MEGLTVDTRDGGYSFWAVPADSVTVDGSTFKALAGGSIPSIVDSGTSCLILPSPAYEEFTHSFVFGLDCSANGCVGDCTGSYPSITYRINGNDYTIDSKDYFIPLGKAGKCQACVSNGGNQLLLGDVFHRKFAVTYDFDNKRVGLPGVTPGFLSGIGSWINDNVRLFVLICCIFLSICLRIGCWTYRKRRNVRRPALSQGILLTN